MDITWFNARPKVKNPSNCWWNHWLKEVFPPLGCSLRSLITTTELTNPDFHCLLCWIDWFCCVGVQGQDLAYHMLSKWLLFTHGTISPPPGCLLKQMVIGKLADTCTGKGYIFGHRILFRCRAFFPVFCLLLLLFSFFDMKERRTRCGVFKPINDKLGKILKLAHPFRAERHLCFLVSFHFIILPLKETPAHGYKSLFLLPLLLPWNTAESFSILAQNRLASARNSSATSSRLNSFQG